MYFREWCEAVTTGWRRLSGLLWPQTPRQRCEAELARLDAELRRRQAALLRLRRRIERLRDQPDAGGERLRRWEEAYRRRVAVFDHRKRQRGQFAARLATFALPSS
jgi:hypothetical protein